MGTEKDSMRLETWTLWNGGWGKTESRRQRCYVGMLHSRSMASRTFLACSGE